MILKHVFFILQVCACLNFFSQRVNRCEEWSLGLSNCFESQALKLHAGFFFPGINLSASYFKTSDHGRQLKKVHLVSLLNYNRIAYDFNDENYFMNAPAGSSIKTISSRINFGCGASHRFPLDKKFILKSEFVPVIYYSLEKSIGKPVLEEFYYTDAGGNFRIGHHALLGKQSSQTALGFVLQEKIEYTLLNRIQLFFMLTYTRSSFLDHSKYLVESATLKTAQQFYMSAGITIRTFQYFVGRDF